MAKTSGLGMRFAIDGYDIAGDVQSLTCRGGPAVWDATAIDNLAFARQGLLRDGAVSAVTYVNPGELDYATPLVDTGSHYSLRAMPLTDRIITCWMTQTSDAFSMIGKQGNYDPVRNADGSMTASVNATSNGYGLEWGDQLTAGKVSVSGAGAQTSVDFTAATAFGAQAYLQVPHFDGTDATVAIQSSSDNGAGDAWANVSGLVFDEITTGPQAQRKETARTASIERYLRVNVSTTGGFTELVFIVVVTKNLTLTNF